MEIKGIDVSEYQGTIDWEQVALSGYRYAVLRSIKRSGIDQKFEQNYTEARAAGFQTGVYAFSYAMDEAAARQEAMRVLRLLNQRPLELPIFLDLEWNEQRKLGREKITEIALEFLHTILENSHYKVGIYCNTDWYQNALDVKRLPYDFWIASYGNNTGVPEKKPEVPDLCGWQYTSNGLVPGVPGPADLDLFYKEYGQAEEKPSGWVEEDGGWKFYLGNTGEPVRNDWYQDRDGNWYWFDGAGFMVENDWYEYKGYWYYLGSDGAMVKGLQKIKDKWYYMYQDGKMATEPVTFIPDQEGALQFPEEQEKAEAS